MALRASAGPPQVRSEAVFDPQRSRKSLLEVRCECPGPPKMYIDVLGSWDTGVRRLTIISGFAHYSRRLISDPVEG